MKSILLAFLAATLAVGAAQAQPAKKPDELETGETKADKVFRPEEDAETKAAIDPQREKIDAIVAQKEAKLSEVRQRQIADMRKILREQPLYKKKADLLFRIAEKEWDEAKYRHLEAVPELGIYRKMREVSVGLYFGFRLGELTDGIELPTLAREHSVIRNLESRAAYIVGLANDIYTVEKEMARGEVNNMVLVLMHEESIDFDTALERAAGLHDAETREFMHQVNTLPSFGAEVDAQVRRYIEVLTSMISGHRIWARETGRYDSFPVGDEPVV